MGKKILVPVLIVIAGLIAIAWMLRQQPATTPTTGSTAPQTSTPAGAPQSHPVIPHHTTRHFFFSLKCRVMSAL